MTRLSPVVLALIAGASAARADELSATRSMPLVELTHSVDIRIENGVATYTVRRTFQNSGDTADQVELVLGLPYGAAATGLRIKARDRWYAGELMEREQAAKLYEEMTGLGQYAPKDPALLAWMWADTLSLQMFPVMPRSVSTVEYTLTAPTRYAGGRYFVSYPRVAEGATKLATPVVTVRFGWGDAKARVTIDNKDVRRDAPVALVPPPKQDFEELVEYDRSASYVASKIVVPSNSHTDRSIAKVKLSLDLRHTYKSDLRVELLTPQNQRVEVFGGGGGGANDLRGTFPLDLPEGTTGAGMWRLLVSDHAGLDTGSLDRWSIDFGAGKDRTIAAAADTPMFVPDAPANASEAGVATIAIDPPPIAMLAGRLGKVVASKAHAFSRLELDLAPQLVPTPKRAQVVFVVDTSYSMLEAGLDAQLALVLAYATHVPDAEIELVTFRRTAERVFGRFVPVRELERSIASARKAGRFALGNGSNLDLGARLAAQALATRTGPRRVVLATDELFRDALTSVVALGALSSLSPDTVVHVVVPKLDGDDRPTLSRRDDAAFAQLATTHHGIYADLGGFPASTVKDLAPTVLELVRPTRIERAAITGFELEQPFLREGDGLRLMLDNEGKPAPDTVTLTGTLWSDPVEKVFRVSAPFSVQTAAFVFGGDLHQSLSEAEQMTVAMMGRAVSPVTSYVAAEPGTRPSPIGLDRGFGTIGMGRYGTIGHGSGSGAGFGLPPIDWQRLIDSASCVASERPSAPWTITLELETTLAEVVDVRAQTPGRLATCLAENAWKLKLDAARFDDQHHTYTIELSGMPVP